MDTQALLNSNITVVPNRPNREQVQVSMVDVFGIQTGVKMTKGQPVLDASGQPVKKDVLIQGFKEPGILTPEKNTHYKFPQEETVEFLKALRFRDTTYLIGHSGTGKTQLVNQVAARLNYNVVTINFDGHLSRSNLIVTGKQIGRAHV